MGTHSEAARQNDIASSGTGRRKILLVAAPTSVNNPKTAFVPLALFVLGTCLKKLQSQTALDFDYGLVDLDLALRRGHLWLYRPRAAVPGDRG